MSQNYCLSCYCCTFEILRFIFVMCFLSLLFNSLLIFNKKEICDHFQKLRVKAQSSPPPRVLTPYFTSTLERGFIEFLATILLTPAVIIVNN